MSDSRYELVPIGEGAEGALERVFEAFGRSGVTLSECLDTDSAALCASDLQYFDKRYFGKVPTYAVFMRYLNKLPMAQRDEFMSTVAEIESGKARGGMSKIAGGSEIGLEQVRRFNMLKDLGNLAEKRIDRLDKRAAARAASAETSVDLAARLISALSNNDLLRIKGQVDTIDAEYKEVALAEGDK